MAQDIIVFRNGGWSLYRRVPTRFAAVEDRKHVLKSLKTDSRSVAERKAAAVWANLVEGWEARLAGQDVDAEKRFAAAHNLAAHLGFNFLPAERVAALPLEERARRVRATIVNGKPDPLAAAALLGGAPEAKITVSKALDLYWTLAKDKTLGKSEDQLRRWQNPLKKATRNFVEQVGDKALADITGDDMLDFRQWWLDRLEAEDLTPNSANKDLTHLAVVWRTVNKMKRLGLVLPLSDLSFREGERRARPPFSVEWIKTRLLKPGALDGLNTEARCIVLGMVNTGYRPSEGAGLLPQHIRLDGKTPYISIEPVGRQLKNETSRRLIPLTGVSLEAFRACPKGFPTYAGKDKISATINAFLAANGLKQTPDHSLYSLRHSFEDRMLTAGIDERIRRDLMGHSLGGRERYGEGGALEHRAKLLEGIAL
ncbi:integrase [Methylopila capsulata]|uniref:Integrase n=1 Tax=Methylopila capsulata TaxID=61654 RepID=A0A9W6IRQ8_9HYPH|nr:tyrosine-type recombinase/integrase [Methylopila capsulata]MBM7851291.1 integrase [Methylopila capsulata]GLK54349.1 integrase [Methylopila capsulata]